MNFIFFYLSTYFLDLIKKIKNVLIELRTFEIDAYVILV